MAHIGILIVPPIQLLDLSPIDLLAMTSRAYFEECNLSEPFLDIAIPTADITLTYISHTGAGSLCMTTAGVRLAIDAGIDDERVTPGKLDILMIPGPPPSTRPPEEVLSFVRAHVEKGADLLTVCTGAFVAGYAGVLDGKKASGPRGSLDMLRKKCPTVEWMDKRWVHEGRIWTSGGISNGMDMMAVYLKHRWPGALSDTVLNMAEVEPRSIEYGGSKPRFPL